MHFTPGNIACNERVEINREEMRRDGVEVRREKRVEMRRDNVTLIKLTAGRRILSIQNTAQHRESRLSSEAEANLME